MFIKYLDNKLHETTLINRKVSLTILRDSSAEACLHFYNINIVFARKKQKSKDITRQNLDLFRSKILPLEHIKNNKQIKDVKSDSSITSDDNKDCNTFKLFLVSIFFFCLSCYCFSCV